MKYATLIIEDDEIYARSLDRFLRHEGFEPTIARSGEEGLRLLPDVRPALVLVDIGLPSMDGIEVIRRIAELEPSAVCIVVSGLATVENTVAAMKAGAFDIIQKSSEETELRLRRAIETATLKRRVAHLQNQEISTAEIIGESPQMQQLSRQIDEVAAAPSSTVLIVGETGTGKELVARAVHSLSERREEPLVAVNCAAVPENLIESEFFGHEKGAFTGADHAKTGLFEAAHGGTLFFDEIGDLDLRLQAKLLRVVEERLIMRVGGSKEIKVDVRLVAATNRDLEKLVAEGTFREDMYYRLNVFRIDVPPLAERGGDVILLAHHFMNEFARQTGKRITGIEPSAERALLAYPFPGNVRQLRNLIEQAVILSHGGQLTTNLLRGIHTPITDDEKYSPLVSLPPPPSTTEDSGDMLAALRKRQTELERFELEIIDRALDEATGNKTRAAELLGMSRYALQRRIRHLEEILK